MTDVAVVKGPKPGAMVRRALGLIGAEKLIAPSSSVLIKPNCVFPRHPSTGVTTDCRVVEGVVEFLTGIGVRDITVGEGGNKDVDETFEITGVRGVAEKHGVSVVNLNHDDYDVVNIPSARSLHRVPISKTVLESPCIINVPTLKIHHMAQVTLSIKNLMGAIVGDRGTIMHRRIDDKLVDLAGLLKPRLNIIDGIVGSEVDEVWGRPVKTDVIIAGESMVSTDAVGSAVMGLKPETVRHLQRAEKRGLGVASLDRIRVLGEGIESVKREYRQGFSEKRLRDYGFDHDVGEAVLRPLWEGVGSNLAE